MDAPQTPNPGSAQEPLQRLAAYNANPAAWQQLIDELTLLNVKLEYLKLMLKLGVRRC